MTETVIKPDVFVDGPLSAPDPDLSRSMGGNNCFYHHCENLGGRPNYAVCLHTQKQAKLENPLVNPACVGAIAAGTCRALKLRAEEVSKGHSIYFYSRDEQIVANQERQAKSLESAGYGRRRGVSTVPLTDPASLPIASQDESTRKPQTKKPAPSGFDAKLAATNLIGEAINRTMENS